MLSELPQAAVNDFRSSPTTGGSRQSTRQYERTNVALPVQLRQAASQAPVWTQTADICPGGCYVGLSFTLEVSAQVDVTIWIGETKIHVSAEIVSNHPGFGNGMKFTHISLEDKQKLETFLQALMPFKRLPVRGQHATSSS